MAEGSGSSGAGPAGASPSADDSIGSLGQETVKLLRAIAAERMRVHDAPAEVDDAAAATGPSEATQHVCSTGWCPVCQVVGYVQDHPELVEQVTETLTDAAIQIGRVLRDFLDKNVPPEK